MLVQGNYPTQARIEGVPDRRCRSRIAPQIPITAPCAIAVDAETYVLANGAGSKDDCSTIPAAAAQNLTCHSHTQD